MKLSVIIRSISFRYKILISYIAIFFVLIILMYIFASHLVENIVIGSMRLQANQLIQRIQKAPSDEMLIQSLHKQKYLVFFRVSIINDSSELLYDSYTKRFVETGREAPKILNYPEVTAAFKNGFGTNERRSKRSGDNFFYMAKTFDFHGKTYVVRTAIPMKFMKDLTEEVEMGLVLFSSFVLLLFGLLCWLVVNRLTRPIQTVIKAIQPYQEGKVTTLPSIEVSLSDNDNEFRRLANTLNSLSAKIQDQINSITQERNEKEAVLESLYKILNMRRDFISNASHELKTPIAIIGGYVETLHDHPDLPVETSREIIEKVMRNCLRMGRIVKDLLVLTDIDSMVDIRSTKCDIEEIIHHCSQTVKELYPNSNIEIQKDSDDPFSLYADPHLLEIAITNLLENAGKYSKSPAQITIHLEKEESSLKVAIQDKGIGIPKMDLDRIFERFYTVNKAHSRKLGGAGLGLSIVSGIVQKHKGTIAVESEHGLGTKFTLTFPSTR